MIILRKLFLTHTHTQTHPTSNSLGSPNKCHLLSKPIQLPSANTWPITKDPGQERERHTHTHDRKGNKEMTDAQRRQRGNSEIVKVDEGLAGCNEFFVLSQF